jgi:hypothetical protein
MEVWFPCTTIAGCVSCGSRRRIYKAYTTGLHAVRGQWSASGQGPQDSARPPARDAATATSTATPTTATRPERCGVCNCDLVGSRMHNHPLIPSDGRVRVISMTPLTRKACKACWSHLKFSPSGGEERRRTKGCGAPSPRQELLSAMAYCWCGTGRARKEERKADPG